MMEMIALERWTGEQLADWAEWLGGVSEDVRVVALEKPPSCYTVGGIGHAFLRSYGTLGCCGKVVLNLEHEDGSIHRNVDPGRATLCDCMGADDFGDVRKAIDSTMVFGWPRRMSEPCGKSGE